MKKSLSVIGLVVSGLILCACEGQKSETKENSNATVKSTATTASKGDPKVVEEVRELLGRHDKALNDKNLEAVMLTFSTDPKTVVLGTGKGERFVGQNDIKQAYTEIFKDYDPGTLQTNCEWKTGGVDESGTMAWFGATCAAKDSMKGVPREYVLNVSGAALKQPEGWRFVMLHMSNTT